VKLDSFWISKEYPLQSQGTGGLTLYLCILPHLVGGTVRLFPTGLSAYQVDFAQDKASVWNHLLWCLLLTGSKHLLILLPI